MSLAALLLLADGRLPAGGHAHSGGAETAVARGLVHDAGSLRAFVHGRLLTAGRVAAGGAAAGCRALSAPAPAGELARLDTELDARTPSPAARSASRSQGRALRRLARTSWPSGAYADLPPAPHHALVLGVVAAVAGCGPYDAAVVAALHAVSGPATAVVRLLGLDPYAVSAVQAALAGEVERVAREAVDAVDAADLPATGSPLLDLLAEEHAAAAVPLFAS